MLDEHKRIDAAIGLVAIGRYRDAEVTLRQLPESSSTNAQFYRNLAAICQRKQPLEEGLWFLRLDLITNADVPLT